MDYDPRDEPPMPTSSGRGKQLPQNTDAEASLLGAILIDIDALFKIADAVERACAALVDDVGWEVKVAAIDYLSAVADASSPSRRSPSSVRWLSAERVGSAA